MWICHQCCPSTIRLFMSSGCCSWLHYHPGKNCGSNIWRFPSMPGTTRQGQGLHSILLSGHSRCQSNGWEFCFWSLFFAKNSEKNSVFANSDPSRRGSDPKNLEGCLREPSPENAIFWAPFAQNCTVWTSCCPRPLPWSSESAKMSHRKKPLDKRKLEAILVKRLLDFKTGDDVIFCLAEFSVSQKLISHCILREVAFGVLREFPSNKHSCRKKGKDLFCPISVPWRTRSLKPSLFTQTKETSDRTDTKRQSTYFGNEAQVMQTKKDTCVFVKETKRKERRMLTCWWARREQSLYKMQIINCHCRFYYLFDSIARKFVRVPSNWFPRKYVRLQWFTAKEGTSPAQGICGYVGTRTETSVVHTQSL